jgi:hypothetical protein
MMLVKKGRVIQNCRNFKSLRKMVLYTILMENIFIRLLSMPTQSFGVETQKSTKGGWSPQYETNH